MYGEFSCRIKKNISISSTIQMYRKNSCTISDEVSTFLVMLNVLKHFILQFFCINFAFYRMFSGMENSVDPDQTAPSGAV